MSAKKYPLGIALGGGGAKAAAHCGALQALKEFGIQPDIISGTSAGAIVAVLHASGYTPAQMIELFSGLNFFKDIITPGLPKGGFFDSKPLVEYLRKVVPYSRIEDLPVPVHIVASDMEHGMAKVFTKGELAPRVVASCSIPVVFRPMAINGVHYVDGGAFQNLPVTAIREKCEKILAFNLIHINEGKYRDNVVSVAYRTFSMMFMSASTSTPQAAPCTTCRNWKCSSNAATTTPSPPSKTTATNASPSRRRSLSLRNGRGKSNQWSVVSGQWSVWC